MKTINLSPSKVSTYENCPRAYYYQYVLRARCEEQSVHLGFGGAIAKGIETFVVESTAGRPVDPVAVFDTEWSKFIGGNVVRFGARMGLEDLTGAGRALMQQLPGAWEESGFMAVVDKDQKPILERGLSVDVGNGVVLHTKLDILVMNFEGEIGVVDAKSPSQASSKAFTLNAEQLTAYQVAVNAHAADLGIDKVSFVSYWEFLKKKLPSKKSPKGYSGPEILRPVPVPARPQEDVDDYIGKLHAVGDAIRSKRFYKSPRMAFNSPCDMCDFARLCIEKDAQGYSVPPNVNPALLTQKVA